MVVLGVDELLLLVVEQQVVAAATDPTELVLLERQREFLTGAFGAHNLWSNKSSDNVNYKP